MANKTVVITDLSFNPNPVTIEVGDTITWSNNTQHVHVVTGPTFTTGQIQPNADSLPIVFDFADPQILYASSAGPQGTIVVNSIQEAIVHWPQVKALFTDEDVQHMIPFGMDLSNKDDVCSLFEDIVDRVTRNGPGRMPPPPRPKWSDADVNLLRTWKGQGCPE